jgi:hypothetical protein
MCDFLITPLVTAFGGGATAAGATAGAATFGQALSTIGTIVGVGGSIYTGIVGAKEARDQAKAIGAQRDAEAQKTAIEDRRTRAQFMSATRRQAAELAARGIAMDSPTAILLGRSAAQEMSFASQGVRQGGTAKDIELSATQRALRARGTIGLLGGFTSAADRLLTATPTLWPELNA